MNLSLLFSVILIALNSVDQSECKTEVKTQIFDSKICKNKTIFDDNLRQQILTKSGDVKKIIDFVLTGKDKGVTYNELAKFTDKFGPRFTGSPSLEASIDYMVKKLRDDEHLDNVHTEVAEVPKWVRKDNKALFQLDYQ